MSDYIAPDDVTYSSEQLDVVRDNIRSGIYTVCRRRGDFDDIWQIFGRVLDMSGERVKNVVACRICETPFPYYPLQGTDHLRQHTCYLMYPDEPTPIAFVAGNFNMYM
ncbi:hypothetical protein KR067_001518 [Drosophila pandora]|nr:hypothetical protein KR067_001518 [Drosophila pandora]